MNIRSGGFCDERQRLLDEFVAAAREMRTLLDEQIQAAVEADPDFARFDMLIHAAADRKKNAKYAWMRHLESHRCGDAS